MLERIVIVIELFSNLMIPLLVLVVILYGFYKKVAIYDVFIDGAKESFDIVFTLFPCLLGMLLGVNLLLKSGVLNVLFKILSPLFNLIRFPVELLPMAILRSVSGSTTLAMMNQFFESYGPDSFIGRLASVIQGSSDTTIYVLTLYFGSIGVIKTKYALKVGLIADFCGILASVIIVRLFFS